MRLERHGSIVPTESSNYLLVMRNSKLLNPKSVHLEDDEQKVLTEENAQALYDFTVKARNLVDEVLG